jgi:HSP20 family protein
MKEEKTMKKEEKKEGMELARKTPEQFNPLSLVRRFTNDMERLFEDFEGYRFPLFFGKDFDPFPMELEKIEWLPPVEVLKKDGHLLVRADLPGMTKDDVKVELTNDMLMLSGERKQEKEEKHEGFYRSERSYGNFYRQIPLPEGVKTENAHAVFHNGVLEITMPAPKTEPRTRKLEIKEGPVAKAMKATA